MSFHDIKETTRISPASTADQISPLTKEFLETAIAGIKSASRDRSGASDLLMKDGTMLLGLAPLTDFLESAKTSEQVQKLGRRTSEDSSSVGRSGGGTSNRSGDAPHSHDSESPRSGDALQGRSTHEQIANTISAAKDALRSRSRESEAAMPSLVVKTALEAIGKAISELSQPDYGLKSDIEATLPVVAPPNIAPPPRPK